LIKLDIQGIKATKFGTKATESVVDAPKIACLFGALASLP
jgi:hypothetical protein